MCNSLDTRTNNLFPPEKKVPQTTEAAKEKTFGRKRTRPLWIPIRPKIWFSAQSALKDGLSKQKKQTSWESETTQPT